MIFPTIKFTKIPRNEIFKLIFKCGIVSFTTLNLMLPKENTNKKINSQ